MAKKKKKSKRKKRSVEFTAQDKNEKLLERGRRRSTKAAKRAEKELTATTGEAIDGTWSVLRGTKYRATKAVDRSIKSATKQMNLTATKAATTLTADIKVSFKETMLDHSALFGYEYDPRRMSKAIKSADIGNRLSKNLHRANRNAMKSYRSTLKLGIKTGEEAVSLAKKLSSISDIVTRDISIPAHISEIERVLRKAARMGSGVGQVAQIKEINAVLKKHKSYIDGLTRSGADGFQHLGIGRATKKFASQAEAFASDITSLNESNIDKIVEEWQDSKIKYYQTRVTRTETNRASAEYSRSYWTELKTDGLALGVDVVLSDSHPVYDICDELQGRYTDIASAPLAPHHPNCICRNVVVIPNELRYNAGDGGNKPFVRGEATKGNGRK